MKKLAMLLLMAAGTINAQKGCMTPQDVFCTGQTVTINAYSAAGQCASCYDWDINGNTTSSDNQTVGNVKIVGSDMGSSVNIECLSAGSFTVTVNYINETGCHECTRTYEVTDCAAEMPDIECFGFDPISGSLNQAWVNNGAGSIPDAGLTFEWTFVFTSGPAQVYYVQNPTFTVNCPGNPVVRFKLVISNGVDTVTMYNNYPGFPDYWTCFAHENCGMGGGLGKQAPKAELFKVTPNPTKSLVNFEGRDKAQYNVAIYDQNGNKVLTTRLDKPANIENQKPGVYFYVITSADGYKQQGKIIRE
jgi:hypothetical protein